MSEHEDDQPPPGRWRLDGDDRDQAEMVDPHATIPGGAQWSSPGAGRPFPGEVHAAETSALTDRRPAPWRTAPLAGPAAPTAPAAPARAFSYPYPGAVTPPPSRAAVPVNPPPSANPWPPPPTGPAAAAAPSGTNQPPTPSAAAAATSSTNPWLPPPTTPVAPVAPSATNPWAVPTAGGSPPYGSSPGLASPPTYPDYRSYPVTAAYPTATPPSYGDYPSYAAPAYPPQWSSPGAVPSPGYGGTGWSGAGGWPPPSPPTYGSWEPAPQPGWAPVPTTAPPKRNGLAIIGVAMLIAALIGLAIGGQLVARHNTAGRGTTLAPSANGGFGSPGANGGLGSGNSGNGGVNPSGTGLPSAQAQAIANGINPSVVDINAKLGYQQAAAAGTGMVLTSDGQVLTNNHVIAGATSLSATVVGGKTYDVKVLGTDPTEDVALIKLVNASGLTPIKTGDPAKLQPGDPIVAVGNAGGVGGTPSVVTGNVVALNQSVTASDMGGGNAEQLSGLIQIDAPLQPGDSGGPLVTAGGQVVGMDTAASTSSRFESQGSVGFAIPITHARMITDEIAAGHGSDTIQIGLPGFLGVSVPPTAAPGAPAGAGISDVIAGTPAAKSGLASGDVITSIDGQTVDAPKTLTAILQQHHSGDKVVVGWVDPAGKSHKATITLITGPAA